MVSPENGSASFVRSHARSAECSASVSSGLSMRAAQFAFPDSAFGGRLQCASAIRDSARAGLVRISVCEARWGQPVSRWRPAGRVSSYELGLVKRSA
jgi:hypothetical protein